MRFPWWWELANHWYPPTHCPQVQQRGWVLPTLMWLPWKPQAPGLSFASKHTHTPVHHNYYEIPRHSDSLHSLQKCWDSDNDYGVRKYWCGAGCERGRLVANVHDISCTKWRSQVHYCDCAAHLVLMYSCSCWLMQMGFRHALVTPIFA